MLKTHFHGPIFRVLLWQLKFGVMLEMMKDNVNNIKHISQIALTSYKAHRTRHTDNVVE